jgi:N-acetylglucosaminyldiphosphoundecaprenol N-acetyl-beta-D-mannosaminyltransferase
MLVRRKILSLEVTKGSYAEIMEMILGLAKSKISSYVCIANVHMLLETYYSKSFQIAVNSANIVTADGMPIAKSFKFLYGENQDRVDGMSMLPDLITASIENNMSIFFYGGSENMLDKTKDFLTEHFPRIKIAGLLSPPFRPLTTEEKKEDVNTIIQSGANIVFVVLGCPKQEQWMYEMRGQVPAVMLGIGGALPVFIGLQKRAPRWMQKNSLEWLFRLIQEPKRLFKRYLKTNTHFLYLILREKLIG